MLCIVYAALWKWMQISKISFALKNTKKKTSCKYTTTSNWFQKTKPNCPKAVLAIAKILPKYRRCHNIFWWKKNFFFFFLQKQKSITLVGCQLFKTKHCHWRSSYCLDMFKHVHFRWFFLPSLLEFFLFISPLILYP